MRQQAPLLSSLLICGALFASCAPFYGTVEVDASSFEGRITLLEVLLASELPPGFRWAEKSEPAEAPPEAAVAASAAAASAETADFRISYRASFTTSAELEAAAAAEDRSIVNAEYYVPVLPYWSARRSVASEELGARTHTPAALGKDTADLPAPLVPLDQAALPWKAVALDELYPDKEAYAGLYLETLQISSVAAANSTAAAAAAAQVPSSKTTDTPTPTQQLAAWLAQASDSLGLNGGRLAAPKVFRLGAVGDIMPGRGVDATLLASEAGIKSIFGDVLPLLQGQDFLIGNLETTATLLGKPWAKSYTFRVSPAVLPKLRQAGFDYLSLTNNHAYDFGEEAFVDTLKNIREAGMHSSGAGANLEEARKPYDLALDDYGLSLRVQSLGAFPNEASRFQGLRDAAATDSRAGMLWRTEENLQHLRELFADTDNFSVLVTHAGYEWVAAPDAGMRSFLRGLADGGADLIVAHHPHVLQGIEVRGGSIIAYSLGNFIFPGMQETNGGEETMLLSLGLVDGQVRYLDYYAVQISGRRIALGSAGIATRVEAMSKALFVP